MAGENLKLNPKLDYSSDSQDGPLISGDNMDDGFVAGKPAYSFSYGEGCFNSKRQARRTVSSYEKYKGGCSLLLSISITGCRPRRKTSRRSTFAVTFPRWWYSMPMDPRCTTLPEKSTRR